MAKIYISSYYAIKDEMVMQKNKLSFDKDGL